MYDMHISAYHSKSRAIVLVIEVPLREKLFIPKNSMLGVSTGEVETMRSEFDRDATMYVSDVCLHSPTVDDALYVNASHGGVFSTTEMPHVRQFLELALPYTLTFFPCTSHGICCKFIWTKFCMMYVAELTSPLQTLEIDLRPGAAS